MTACGFCRKNTIYIFTYDNNHERVAAQPDATLVDALRVSWLPRARVHNGRLTNILAQARAVNVNNRASGTPCTHIPTENLRADCASMDRSDIQLTYRVLKADVQALLNH